MTEAMESREFVADWLRQVPDFMAEYGFKDTVDLACRLKHLGSGGHADVIYLGMFDGEKRVLKITSDESQAEMSQAALEDRPMGIVPVYDVVATDIQGRVPSTTRTWGVIERFVVPIESIREIGRMKVAGESGSTLIDRYAMTWRAYDHGRGGPDSDPDVEDWRQLYAAAIEWVEDVCRDTGGHAKLDLHEGNWGVDPTNGNLLLIDLGQC